LSAVSARFISLDFFARTVDVLLGMSEGRQITASDRGRGNLLQNPERPSSRNILLGLNYPTDPYDRRLQAAAPRAPAMGSMCSA
jgi:hypothetical protein